MKGLSDRGRWSWQLSMCSLAPQEKGCPETMKSAGIRVGKRTRDGLVDKSIGPGETTIRVRLKVRLWSWREISCQAVRNEKKRKKSLE